MGGADPRHAAARAAYIVRALTPTNAPPADPAFPAVPRRDRLDRQPMAVRALPERWVVVGSDDGRAEVLRRWFDQPVAPRTCWRRPRPPTDRPLATEEVVDRYLGWAADYAQALAAGMAVTSRRPTSPAARCPTGSAASSSSGFGRATAAPSSTSLLAAHAVTDGLAFLRPGTPTNNLDDDGRPSADVRGRPDARRRQTSTRVVGRRRGWRRRSGSRSASWAASPGAEHDGGRVASAVVSATWAGDARLLRRPAAPAARRRRHLDRGPRARPELPPAARAAPTLRVGRQPLGVLPVMAARAARRPTAFGDRLGRAPRHAAADVASGCRSSEIPRLDDGGRGRAGAARRPAAGAVDDARLVPPGLRPAVGLAAGGLGTTQQLQSAVRSIGVPRRARRRRAAAPRAVRRAARAALAARPDRSATRPRTSMRVRRLTTSADAREVLNQAADADSLLEALVTFAALQELDLAAARIGRRFLPAEVAGRSPGGRPRSAASPEASAIRIRGRWRPRRSPSSAGARSRRRSLAARSSRRPGPRRPDRVPGRARRPGRGRSRAGRPGAARLPRRLLAPARRVVHVAGQPAAARRPQAHGPGLHLGGYGCVERLRPETTPGLARLRHRAVAGPRRDGRRAAQRAPRQSQHRPPRRRPQLGAGARGAGADARRARGRAAVGAARLPARAGAARRGPRAVHPRRCAPSSRCGRPPRTRRNRSSRRRRTTSSTPPICSSAGRAVFIDPVPPPFVFRVAQRVGLPIDDPRVERMMVQFTALADTYDAVADVVLAEAVHQTLAANPERAQAATRFLDRQEAPVEPDVTATPRRSHAYVQRCAVAIGPPQLSAAWRPLAANDPRVRPSRASTPGSPSCSASPPPGGSAGGAWPRTARLEPVEVVTLADLGLVTAGAAGAAVSGGGDRPTELEERIGRVLAGAHRRRRGRRDRAARRHRRRARPRCAHVDVQRDRQGAADGAPRRRPDVRRCPTAGGPSGVDVDELERRATRAEQRLRTVSQRLDAALAVAVPKTGRAAGGARAGQPRRSCPAPCRRRRCSPSRTQIRRRPTPSTLRDVRGRRRAAAHRPARRHRRR